MVESVMMVSKLLDWLEVCYDSEKDVEVLVEYVGVFDMIGVLLVMF